jgi:hypothetical protein
MESVSWAPPFAVLVFCCGCCDRESSRALAESPVAWRGRLRASPFGTIGVGSDSVDGQARSDGRRRNSHGGRTLERMRSAAHVAKEAMVARSIRCMERLGLLHNEAVLCCAAQGRVAEYRSVRVLEYSVRAGLLKCYGRALPPAVARDLCYWQRRPFLPVFSRSVVAMRACGRPDA